MLLRALRPCALAVSFGGGACGPDTVLVLTHEAATTPTRADAGAGALAPPGADDDAGVPGAGASDAGPGLVNAPPPRELELPSRWAEHVASVCRSDGELCAGDCPTFADGLERVRMYGRAATRDYCVSEDGEPYITLQSVGNIEVYRAASGELVSMFVSSDVPDYCYDTVPTNKQVTGAFIEDCLWVRPNPPVACTDASAPDLSSFDHCSYDFRR